MGMRRLGGFENLPTIDLTRNGEGTETKIMFLSYREHVGENDSNIYTAEYRGEDLAKLQKEMGFEGSKIQFWGSAVIDRILTVDAKPGDELTIIFLGKQPSPVKGRSPFKNFDVFLTDPEYKGDDTKEPKKKDVPF